MVQVDFAKIKTDARTRVHQTLRIKARCYPKEDVRNPIDVWLRVHSRLVLDGDLPESGLPFAQRVEVLPRLVFMAAEHRPRVGNTYSLGDGTVYRVTRMEPIDGITITAIADRLKEADANQWSGP